MDRLLLLGIALATIPHAAAQTVRAWEGTITLPTYAIYGSDINPHFYDIEGSILYPYSMQDDLGDERTDRTYRAVFLENEFLKVICLPQIGGRIHSVLDKTTNHEMFHRNDVIKPGLIAMRGAWISGGIEWNRGPQGHTVTSFSPVDVASRENPDGSASLVVGYTEANFRTYWSVVLTLHPGKAYLHESISLFNPTDGMHSYYFWNNTAFPCKPGTRFIYPMKLGQDHAGTSFFTWPVHNGKDMTWLKNYDEPSSVFAYQCAFDFFGAYDVDDDRGIVQYGDHRILTGKKAWTWGQSGDGIASQRALHDDDSQYIEVQSGPLQTQADYGLLGPRQKVAWEEWWYPVHALGDGFEYATKDVAVQTHWPEGDGGQLEVRLLSTGVFPGAVCSVRKSGTPGTIKAIDLSPNAAAMVHAPVNKGDRVTIEVRSASGEELARYVSPLDIPDRTPPPAITNDTPRTVEQRYLEGVKHEERIQPGPARAAYEHALEADPGHSDALVALARLDCGRGNYAQAAEYAQKAAERDPGKFMAWYYLGLAAMYLPEEQRPMAPIDAAYKAINTLDNPSLGHDLAGRIRMRERRYADAVAEFKEAVAQNPGDSRAHDNLVVALYAAGNLKDAEAYARMRIASDPLAFVPRAVIGLQRRGDLYDFCEYMKRVSGRYDFDMLLLTMYLVDLGLYADARNLMAEAYDEPVPNATGVLYQGEFPDTRLRPAPWYVLGWLSHMAGDDTQARAYVQQGKALRPDYQFPSDPKMAEVYRYAISLDPNDANAHLTLGNLLAYQGDLEGAVAEWKQAASGPDLYSVAFRNLAMYAWKKENDLAKASQLFAKAIEVWPSDQTLYRDAAAVLIARHKTPDAIALLEGMKLDHPRRGDITVLLARAYNDEKRYDDTLDLLGRSKFSNWELNTESWQAFHRAHIERGKVRFEAKQYDAALEDFAASLTYPEFLGVGRSARPEESEGLYWKGKALDALGRKDEARAAWAEGAAGTEKSDTQKDYIKRCKEALGNSP